ncbi:MFS transporter [Microtetraspora fusca]|uniref:MFS transporter n=1 Tax=Microtetraspora fusca TaxID=1997 RepID=UPI000B22CBF6|nr:MFS transporter [Microtetraspora fusca]
MKNAGTHPLQTASSIKYPWLPVIAVALSTFTVVSSEMMPVGLLTPIADTLSVSDGVTGLSLTITGIIAAAVSPFVPALIGLRDRKKVLVAFMILLSLANALTAIAPSFLMLASARILLGISMGMVWALAAGLGPRIVDGSRIALATALIFSGVSIASVIGVPLGTYIAAFLGWRAAFWALALLGVVATAVLIGTLPALPVHERSRLDGILDVLRNRGVAAGLAITALVVFGHFTGYTYVRPILEIDAGMSAGLIAACLLVYGLAGVAGNFTLGPLAGGYTKGIVASVLAGVALAAVLLPFATARTVTTLIVLIVWGVSYGAVSVSTQTWVRKADPVRIEASAALWAGVFNASIALGAFAGGIVIDNAGNHAVMFSASLITLAGLIVAITSRPHRPAPGRRREELVTTECSGRARDVGGQGA